VVLGWQTPTGDDRLAKTSRTRREGAGPGAMVAPWEACPAAWVVDEPLVVGGEAAARRPAKE